MIDPGTIFGRCQPYVKTVKIVASETGIDPYRLISLGYTETWLGWAPGYSPQGDPAGWGDAGNAYGLFQFDKRYHMDWILAADAADPTQQCRRAASLLKFNRMELVEEGFEGNFLLDKAVFSAYNGALVKVARCLTQGLDPDTYTTGHDYAKRVFNTAAVLQTAHPLMFS